MQQVGTDQLIAMTGNIAFAGISCTKAFMAEKNLYPSTFGKIAKILLPKDYLAYLSYRCAFTDVSGCFAYAAPASSRKSVVGRADA